MLTLIELDNHPLTEDINIEIYEIYPKGYIFPLFYVQNPILTIRADNGFEKAEMKIPIDNKMMPHITIRATLSRSKRGVLVEDIEGSAVFKVKKL